MHNYPAFPTQGKDIMTADIPNTLAQSKICCLALYSLQQESKNPQKQLKEMCKVYNLPASNKKQNSKNECQKHSNNQAVPIHLLPCKNMPCKRTQEVRVVHKRLL
jgi:hypothetical protein